MRGARWVLPCRPTLSRIIPADAGSTSPLFIVICDKMGSSPRMRGAPALLIESHHRVRIIPADAGSTQASVSPSPYGWDHPRGCGEHADTLGYVFAGGGSSPRMRGAPPLRRLTILYQRIIPADAGSTIPTPIHDLVCQDHPRGCGEHQGLAVAMLRTMGSSPRMRGAQRRRVGQQMG